MLQFGSFASPSIVSGSWVDTIKIDLPTTYNTKHFTVILSDSSPYLGEKGNGLVYWGELALTSFSYRAYNTGGTATGYISIGT